MKITWLGQAGLLFFESNGIKLIVDPYLSDSVEKINPKIFVVFLSKRNFLERTLILL